MSLSKHLNLMKRKAKQPLLIEAFSFKEAHFDKKIKK